MHPSLFDRTTKPPRPLTVNDMFAKTRQQWLEEGRRVAKRLLRYQETITIEDILQIVPRPTYIHRNCTGAVFNKQFKPVGFVQSKRPISKGRWIMQWKLK